VIDPKKITFGAEYEYGDIDRNAKLPDGLSWNKKDYSIVSSTGIANDPKGLLYTKGGEINSRPTETIAEQVDFFEALMAADLGSQLNHRTNLHLHIRVPGLSEDLEALKTLLRYVDENQGEIYRTIEPIPVPTREQFETKEAFQGAMKRCRRRKVSHQYAVPRDRVERALKATSVEEFLAAHAPQDKQGQPAWGLTTRAGINLLQLKETDTVEFRHFTNTLDTAEIASCFMWVFEFMTRVWDNPPLSHIVNAYNYQFPAFLPYNHDMEVGYQYTNFDKNSRKVVTERLGNMRKDLDLEQCSAKQVAEWINKNG
jgi:hypothetical protein